LKNPFLANDITGTAKPSGNDKETKIDLSVRAVR